MAKLLAGETVTNFERTLRRKDGELVTVEVSVALVFGPDGEPLYAHNTARDMTERKKMEQELTEIRQRYQALFERTDEAVFIIGDGMVLLGVNEQACGMLGYSREELEGMGLDKLLVYEEEIRMAREVEETLLARETMPRYEHVLRRKDGELLTVEVSTAMVYGVDGEALYVQSIARDITGQKRLERQLKSSLTEMVVRAATDPLTEMHNRRTVMDYAENALRQAQAREEPFSIVMIDLDDLKGINDSYGHQAGDMALKYLANVLRANLRVTDSGGRWAGDEFLLVLPGTDLSAAEGAANRLLKEMQAGEVELGNGKAMKVSISMGVAGSGVGGEEDLEAVLEKADKAMYQAKADGRNCVRVFR
jgi:diguanylate cyclase (GGDEF)-like protein/PAS domain S-box-containing protein